MVFVVDGNPAFDRVEAASWDEAEAKLNGVGVVVGELVSEGEWKSSQFACGLTELKFATDGNAMAFEGYGAVFNNVDQGGDKILPGAFTETLAQFKASGAMPAMLYQHGKQGGGPVMPVGKWTHMSEDSHGLKVSGQLFDHSIGRDLYVALKGGGIGGLSIGYRVKEFGRPAMGAEERRQLKSVALHEVSLVNDPMNGMARFTAVKSADALKQEIKTLSALGDLVREALGWSRSQTEAVLSNFQAKSKQGEPDAEAAALAAAMMRAAKTLKS
jgi:uncharacterized protein